MDEASITATIIVLLFRNILEVGVLPDCSAHRCLAYAVQQIIAQELEVERLKRTSISTGLGSLNAENAGGPTNPKAIEDIRGRSSSEANNAKQSEKEKVPLKEAVSFINCFIFFIYAKKSNLAIIIADSPLFNNNCFRYIKTSSGISQRRTKICKRRIKQHVVFPQVLKKDIPCYNIC